MLRGVWKDPVFFTFPLGGVWLSKHQSLRRSWMSPWKENPGCFGLFFPFFYMGTKTQPQPTRLDERGYGCKDSLNFYLYFTKWKNAVWPPIFQVPKGRGAKLRVLSSRVALHLHQDFDNILSSLMTFFKLAVGETQFFSGKVFRENSLPKIYPYASCMEYVPTFGFELWYYLEHLG